MKPTRPTGPKNDITDIAGLRVGNADDAALKSGVTVLVGDQPMVTSVAVMGGAPGTRETDLLAPDKSAPAVDALVLSGGSAFGLDAASGVMAGLRSDGRGFEVGPVRVPIVPAAILFDLLNGGDKDWEASPYPDLGRTAYDAASRDLELGTIGAGKGAMTARHKGGLGSASVVLPTGETVAALIAVNAMGSVTSAGDRHFWAAPFEMGNEFGGIGSDPQAKPLDLADSLKSHAHQTGGNTTIGIVATDAALTKAEAHRLAIASHDGIARAVVPAHTPMDGDLLFAASTAQKELTSPETFTALCAAGASVVARSIARAVYLATQEAGDILPCWDRLNSRG